MTPNSAPMFERRRRPEESPADIWEKATTALRGWSAQAPGSVRVTAPVPSSPSTLLEAGTRCCPHVGLASRL